MAGYGNQSRFANQITGMWVAAWLLSSPRAGNVFIQIPIFEADAPLKSIPQQSKFELGACITKKEKSTVKLYIVIHPVMLEASDLMLTFNGLGRRYCKSHWQGVLQIKKYTSKYDYNRKFYNKCVSNNLKPGL